MFIHGGGFTSGDKSGRKQMAPIFKQLEAGWSVVNVNYLLTSGTKNVYPSQMLDLRAAAAYLKGNTGTLGINMSKFVVAGHSAGGTLASLIGVGHNSAVPAFRGFPKVSGWVSISGIADFNLDNLSGMWGRGWMTNSSFASLSTQASPVTHFDRFDPKGYWIHGSRDTLVPPAAASVMLTKSAMGGFADKLQVDLVDDQKNGNALPASSVGHAPAAGANTAELTRWFKTL